MSGVKAFNWNELDRETVRRGVERVGFGSDQVTCVMNWLTPGMEIRPHSHTFEQMCLIIEGRVRMHLGEEVVDLEPGGMIRIPPDVVHYAEPIGDRIALNLDIFAPAREDYQHLLDHQRDAED